MTAMAMGIQHWVEGPWTVTHETHGETITVVASTEDGLAFTLAGPDLVLAQLIADLDRARNRGAAEIADAHHPAVVSGEHPATISEGEGAVP